MISKPGYSLKDEVKKLKLNKRERQN